MLKLVNVGKIYSSNGNVAVGIRKVNMELGIGEFVAITGESGAGKTTLLNVLSGIDSYEEGEMYINGEETSWYSPEDLESYRNRYVGFVFQNYNVVDSYTVLGNVEAALTFVGYDKKTRRTRALELIDRVGLTSRLHTKASKLSGGEKQRVVIARALAKDAPIIAADEPTGNLDSQSAKGIIELLHEVSKDKLVLIVTHDFNEVADYATRIIRVFDGEVKEDRIIKPEVKGKDLPPVPEEGKKASFGDILKLALTDLISSPKRLAFHLFAFLLMSAFVLTSVALYREIVLSSTNINLYSSFSNTDISRLVLNKKDGSVFTDAETSSIKNNQDISSIVTHDYMLDYNLNSIYVNTDNYSYYFGNYVKESSSISESDLECGKLPSKADEVVLTIHKSVFKSDDLSSYESFLGKTLNDYNGLIKSTIVGVVNGDNLADGASSYAYFNQEGYQALAYHRYCSSIISATYSDSTNSTGYIFLYSIEEDSALANDEFKISTPSDSFKAGEYFTLDLHDAYGFLFTKKSYKSVEYDGSTSTTILYLSTANYQEARAHYEANYQISVFVKNAHKLSSVATNLRNSGYRVVVPSEPVSDNLNLNLIIIIAALIGIIQFLIATFFIIYAALLHSVKARKDDIEVLRTIGATKGNIKVMLSSEYIFIGVASYILVMIAFLVVFFTAKPALKQVLQSLDFGDFFLVFVSIILMSFLLSLMFSRSVFKKTVKKGLDQK